MGPTLRELRQTQDAFVSKLPVHHRTRLPHWIQSRRYNGSTEYGFLGLSLCRQQPCWQLPQVPPPSRRSGSESWRRRPHAADRAKPCSSRIGKNGPRSAVGLTSVPYGTVDPPYLFRFMMSSTPWYRRALHPGRRRRLRTRPEV